MTAATRATTIPPVDALVFGEGAENGRAYTVTRGDRWFLEFHDGERRKVKLREAVAACATARLGLPAGRLFDAEWYRQQGIDTKRPIPQFVLICQCGCGEPVTLAPRSSANGLKFLQPHRFKGGHVGNQPIEPRFWARVNKTETCWLWTGQVGGNGYARLCVNGKHTPAHRISYELLVGPIPEGLVIDHLCRVTTCVNPAHLEPVLHRVNVLRGVSPMAQQAKQTHCKRGHEFTPENTYQSGPEKRERRCRTCERDQRRSRAS